MAPPFGDAYDSRAHRLAHVAQRPRPAMPSDRPLVLASVGSMSTPVLSNCRSGLHTHTSVRTPRRRQRVCPSCRRGRVLRMDPSNRTSLCCPRQVERGEPSVVRRGRCRARCSRAGCVESILPQSIWMSCKCRGYQALASTVRVMIMSLAPRLAQSMRHAY